MTGTKKNANFGENGIVPKDRPLCVLSFGTKNVA